ncbi:hypothetical protein DA801_14695 [Lacticaseibacillus rhamnosus]|uniref:DUF1642 domain-containing protein n=1 Tax=Lacticaseibacillus rhamnosus TaxID=47715 RepID=UPI000D324964|nr:DUF1642 domain-containing protein [Lacticaseibacillus rhamnosus]PTM21875.1 hypothetical protein DA801_14695 [Lacticaseibacillus rhamnosus]
MSEEKLYAVKNDEGKYWDFSDGSGFWSLAISDFPTTPNKKQAELAAKDHGGHVVTFVEEPEKVLLSKEQAKIVERAHDYTRPAKYITDNTGNSDDDEELLMNAYVNGCTVKKKYLVYKVLVDKKKHEYFAQAYRSTVHPGTVAWFLHSKAQSDSLAQFTEAEIEHYSLQDCEKEEVTDDDD